MSVSEVDALKCENQRLKEQNKTLIDMLSTLKQMKDMFAIMDQTFNDLSYKIDEIMEHNRQISSNDLSDIDISFDGSLVKDEKHTTDHTIIVHQIINAANNSSNNNSHNICGNNNNHNNTNNAITEVNGNTSYESNGAVMLVNDTLRLSSPQPQYINLYADGSVTDKHTKLALVVNSKQRNRNFFTGKSTKTRRKQRCLTKSSKLKSTQQLCNVAATDKAVCNQQSDSNKPYVCHWAECQYSTAIKAHFKVHLRKHTGEKPYRCDHQNCDYTAASSSQVSRHRRIHLRSASDYFNT